MKNYCVITADIRKSREVVDRGQLQKLIFSTLEEVNKQFNKNLTVKFGITIGDEWQGVLPNLAYSYKISSFFIEQFYPHSLAVGVGEGEITTPVRARSAEMDGPAFHRSRRAIELAKKTNGVLFYETTHPEIDLLINNNCRLLQIIRESWTPRQFQKVKLYKYLKTEAAVAKKLQVSQVDIHKSLSAANGKSFLDAEENLNKFLMQHYN